MQRDRRNFDVWRFYLKKWSKEYSEKLNTEITTDNVLLSIYLLDSDKYEIDFYLDILSAPLDVIDVENKLRNFNFESIKSEIEFPGDWLPEEYQYMIKALVKSQGEIWIIHKYDADPFPSNPHAHSRTQNLKLDLSNGNCYKNRRFEFSINKKHLLEIREKAMAVFKGELPVLAV